jgi:hypothetical protein
VEHISHDRREGWLRYVQAGQAIVSGSASGVDVSGNDEEIVRETDEDGREDESCLGGTGVIAVGTKARGTPHSPQILAAAGLRPGGLR